MHYLLFYELEDDYLTKRPAFREDHLQKAWQSHERGELVLGGALTDPVDRAVLLFKAESPRAAESFAESDPYVKNGLVKRWYVRPWNTVVGEQASTPIKPKYMAAAASGKSLSADEPGILRMWKARSTLERFNPYMRHVTEKVFPSLRRVEGYRGAYLLRRTIGAAIEIVVLTLWDSMDAVRKFAGANPEKAVVDPEARAALTDFDESVTHFEVLHSAVTQKPSHK